MTVTTITPRELAEICKCQGKSDLIDVRTPAEFREVHVEFARNVPLDRLDPAAELQSRGGSTEEPVYMICRSGSRGRQACEKFLAAGFTTVANVEGGTLACVEAGLPIVRGKKTISLERQVRIAAGSLVLLGALLSWLVHTNAITWRASLWEFAAVVGPAAGGMIYGFSGARLAYIVDMVLCAIALALFARIVYERQPRVVSDATMART